LAGRDVGADYNDYDDTGPHDNNAASVNQS